jgi:hypothetical protein
MAAAAASEWQLHTWNDSHRDYPSRRKEPEYVMDRVRDYIAYNKAHHSEPKSLLSFLSKPLKDRVLNYLVPDHRTKDQYQVVSDRRVKIALDEESIRLLKREIRKLIRDNAKLKVSEDIWRLLITNIHMFADTSDSALRAHLLAMEEEEGRKKKRKTIRKSKKRQYSTKKYNCKK